MQFTTFQLREREFILSIQGSFSGPPQLTPRCAIHPTGVEGIYQHEWGATAQLEPGCFPWRWRSWRKSQQELCWSCRVQAGCKACPKPGDCCGAEAGLLRDAGTQGMCWAGAHHLCSPHFPPQQLPRSEIDLFFYSFHPLNFFFSAKRGKNPLFSLSQQSKLSISVLLESSRLALLCSFCCVLCGSASSLVLPDCTQPHPAPQAAWIGSGAGPQPAGEQRGSAAAQVSEGS